MRSSFQDVAIHFSDITTAEKVDPGGRGIFDEIQARIEGVEFPIRPHMPRIHRHS